MTPRSPRPGGSSGGRPRRSPPPYHHGDLREALIDAAAERVEAVGADAVSLRDVARRCGVSQAAPYRHFASLDALLAAVAARGFGVFARTMEEQARVFSDPLDRLKALGRGYVAFAGARPETLRLMFGPAGARAADAELEQAAGAAYDMLSDTVTAVLADRGVTTLPRPVVTVGLWALVHGLARLAIDLPGTPRDLADLDPQSRAARIIDAFVDGLLDAGDRRTRR